MRPFTPTATERLCRLIEPIYDEVRSLARRLARSDSDGDDLFHHALERAMTRVHDLRDDAAFRVWFFRILTTVQRNRHRSWLGRWIDSLRPEDLTADARAEADARAGAARMRRALAMLPAEQSHAVVLCDVHGLSTEETADVLGVSVPAVKSRLSRGRRRLRRIYLQRFGIGAVARGVADVRS
jgi:RNA polymerase sigma-70 factor (ECF subfamily)